MFSSQAPLIVPLAQSDQRELPEGVYNHFLIRHVPVMTRVSITPGAKTRTHLHRNEEQSYYILEGSGLLHAGDATYPVAAQTAIVIPAGQTHALENTGEGPLAWVMQYMWPGDASDPVYSEV